MKTEYIQTGIYTAVDDIDEAISDDAALIIACYGSAVDDFLLFRRLRSFDIPFIGCMDSGRLVDDYFSHDPRKIGLMSISRKVIEKISMIAYDMRRRHRMGSIAESAGMLYETAIQEIGINPDNPNVKREIAINLFYGPQSPSMVLEKQQRISAFLQSVGGSSGGKLDPPCTSVLSSQGMGGIGATAILRLRTGFRFHVDMVSSFELMDGKLTVTKTESPRHITEFNHQPAAMAFAEAVGVSRNDLTQALFSIYTLGTEPSPEDRLFTGIMKEDGHGGLCTYNDISDGTTLHLYRARSQTADRKAALSRLPGPNTIAYISFDSMLCYIAREANREINEIAQIYAKALPDVPKIGFGTSSENLCGVNINQTETFFAIAKAPESH